MNAPIAAGIPSAGFPIAAATRSGIATPIVQRSAYPGSTAERSNVRTVDVSSRSHVSAGDVRAAFRVPTLYIGRSIGLKPRSEKCRSKANAT
jgi:hypothetical protein